MTKGKARLTADSRSTLCLPMVVTHRRSQTQSGHACFHGLLAPHSASGTLLVHCMLPASQSKKRKAKRRPPTP